MTKCKVIKDQEVYYDDCLFVVEQVFTSLDEAVEYVKEYLNVENPICTFESFLEHELEYLEFSGACMMLRGPEEVRGQQPILIISTRDSDLESDPQYVAERKLLVNVVDLSDLSQETLDLIEIPMTFVRDYVDNETTFYELKNSKDQIVRIFPERVRFVQ
jgi:hypothetical protein